MEVVTKSYIGWGTPRKLGPDPIDIKFHLCDRVLVMSQDTFIGGSQKNTIKANALS